jgi:uncharacterized integral membrane protein
VRPRRRVSPRLIAAIFIVALIVLFIAQNRDTVKIQLFAATLTSPLWLLLVVMAGLGAAIGFLLARRRR